MVGGSGRSRARRNGSSVRPLRRRSPRNVRQHFSKCITECWEIRLRTCRPRATARRRPSATASRSEEEIGAPQAPVASRPARVCCARSQSGIRGTSRRWRQVEWDAARSAPVDDGQMRFAPRRPPPGSRASSHAWHAFSASPGVLKVIGPRRTRSRGRRGPTTDARHGTGWGWRGNGTRSGQGAGQEGRAGDGQGQASRHHKCRRPSPQQRYNPAEAGRAYGHVLLRRSRLAARALARRNRSRIAARDH
jgi:hypothetical protein